eukprot:gene45443-60711_t
MNMPLNTSANISDPVAQARYNMIEQQIRPWNVLDFDVLELLAVVRREDFVPPAYRSMAFMDIEVPLLGSDAEEAVRRGHSMLQPRVEARVLQDLQIKPTDRVLEIGAGSGYMAALLAHRVDDVLNHRVVPQIGGGVVGVGQIGDGGFVFSDGGQHGGFIEFKVSRQRDADERQALQLRAHGVHHKAGDWGQYRSAGNITSQRQQRDQLIRPVAQHD